MQPLVSIIVPAYNSANFILEAIQSALDQTWKNIEIIVVDDGSADNTLQIAKSYEGSGIVKALSQKHAGACSARNAGLQLSKGDYIQFLDSDDIIEKNKIEKQMALLKDTEGAISCCDWVRFETDISRSWGYETTYVSETEHAATDWLLTRKMMPLHGWLTPRSIVEKAGLWDETLTFNQDGEFFYRVISNAEKILLSHDTMVYYRTIKNRNNISSLKEPHAHASLFKTALIYKNVVKNKTGNSKEGRIAIGNYFKELEYKFFPMSMDLVKKCREQEEFESAVMEFDVGPKTQQLNSIFGWKTVKYVKWLLDKLSV
jgi:glycosyltransferase involved in cell wall biosynthesis